jgi:hypothetical protein
VVACDGGTPTGPAPEPSSDPALAIGGTPGKLTDQIEIRLDTRPNDPLDVAFTFNGHRPSNLVLDDDADPLLPNFRVMPSLKAGLYTVAADPLPTGYALTGISCLSIPNGGSGSSNNVTSIPNRSVAIRLEKLERVVCTFVVAKYAPLTVTIDQAADQADPAIGTRVTVTFHIVFNNPVANPEFKTANFSGVSLAGLGLIPTGARDGTEYLLLVRVGSFGTLTVSMPAGQSTDIYGQSNAASTSTDNSVTVAAPLTVTINQASDQSDPAFGESEAYFEAVFSNPVTDFDGSDVAVSGVGGGASVVRLDETYTRYRVVVPVFESGFVTADIPANRATDAYGQSNAASTSTDNSVEVIMGQQTECTTDDGGPCTT